jgi:signal transduction histidine kinase
MISDMMLFARPPMLERSPCDLTTMADRVIAELLPDARAQGTSLVRVTSDEPVVVSADGNHLSVALKALCTNSLEAVGRDGSIEVLVRPVTSHAQRAAEEESVEILVSDTGPGISPEVRRHLFDPYFSGREAGRGLGLGLSKCWAIVDQHGGRIRVDSQPGCGTTFTIILPVEACTNTPTAF